MTVDELQAQDLLTILHGNNADAKLRQMQNVKANIKHSTIEVEAIPILFECIKLGMQSSNNQLYLHSFSTLGHMLKRISLQDPNSAYSRLRPQISYISSLIEKLGDQKEKARNLALECLLGFWKACPQEVEKAIKEHGFTSKVPKTREMSIKLLSLINQSANGWSFRSFTPFMIKMLEDADAGVRDMAKDVVIELFKQAPDHARADLKRELIKNQVRKGIAEYIINQLLPGSASIEPRISPHFHEDEPISRKDAVKSMAGSVSGSIASTNFVPSIPGAELEALDPTYINTNRELEDEFAKMHEAFEGKESEFNWLAREKHITHIRRMARGNAYRDYQQTFLTGIRSLLDGILKAVNSLRTTLSTNGCLLVKDLCIICGPGMDPMVDIILNTIIKVCANTKKIAAQMGNVTASVVFANVSYHPKILQHIWGAIQDKNVQPRLFAAGWIRIMLETHADHKGYLEHTGGLDIVEKCLKKGLSDANPGVREGIRGTFWKFAAIWPDRADVIMDTLDATSRKLLEKENPNAKSGITKDPSNRRAAPHGAGKVGGAPSTRSSIKEQMLKKRRELQEKQLEHMEQFPATLISTPVVEKSLSAAPVRPQRPKVAAHSKSHPEVRPPLSITTSRPGAVSPSTTHSSGRSPSHYTRSNAPGSPPHTQRIQRTPIKHSPLSKRKLTVLEQLNDVDWRIRVEGLITVACLLARRSPPNFDGQKPPTLPPSDVLAPTLQKLLNDPQPEVVEHVVAPEVLAELAKVVSMEQLVTKVLLLSEGDDEEHAQPILQSTMPALKALMTEAEAAELLLKVTTSMGASGVVPRKLAAGGTYTTTQKKKIIHGCLVWVNELVERMLYGQLNEFLADAANYRLYANRFIAMLNTTKPPNYLPLATLLRNLQALDPSTFDKILLTFETSTVRDLKKAWGQSVEEEGRSVVEEKVAHVQEVLGEVPIIKETSSSSTANKSRQGSPLASPGSRHRKNISLDRPMTPAKPKPSREDKENKLQVTIKTPESSKGPRSPGLFSRFGADGSTPTASKSLGAPKNGDVIKVFQDPVVESNGAVATGAPPEKFAGSTEWYQSKMKKQISNSNLPKTPEQSAFLLSSLISRLKVGDVDTQALRKLIGVVRENPVRSSLQENNGEEHYDIWKSGSEFHELLSALLDYLSDDSVDGDKAADLKVQGLLVLKQLLMKAALYFRGHEKEVLTTLIRLRGKYPTQSQVTTGIEEISEEFVNIAEPGVSIECILDMMMLQSDDGKRPVTQSWCMGLGCMAALIRSSKISSLEPQLRRLGQLAVKSLDDEDAEVRRACVAMCIEMHSKLNDDQRLFDEILKGMKSGHQNLLTYYFAKKEQGRD